MGSNMLSIHMVSRLRTPFFWRGVLFCAALFASGCQKVPLLAPTGSTITLTASTTALPVNGTTQLIAQVIEASGTPPHTGTQVSFTTTLGTIEPADAQTDANGRVVVTFKAGTAKDRKSTRLNSSHVKISY